MRPDGPEPPRDCPLCPRLAAYRAANAAAEPLWWNGPAPSFGDSAARLLVIGLAPGRTGANRTGRPFTGDYAGGILYPALLRHGFARGAYEARPDDGLVLAGAMITNAVRCAPPENKPTPREAATCRPFLVRRLQALTELCAVLALGRIAHDNTLRALGAAPSRHAFAHGARHDLARETGPLAVFDSYHCSRYNINTGRLTQAMFDDVMAAVAAYVRRATGSEVRAERLENHPY